MIKRILRIILVTFIFLLVGEWVIEWLMARKHAQWATQVKPVYSWSTYSSDGVRLGEKQGILKLILRPYITYGTMPNQRTQYFTINSRGYRGDEVASKSPTKKRIVVVGGSAAFGSGLNEDKETFANQLASLSGFEVINAAVIGHQSGQELSYLVHELIDLEPDLVIAFDGWNDFMQSKWEKNLSQVGDVGFAQIEGQLTDLSLLTQGSMPGRIGRSFPAILFPAIWRGIVGGVKRFSEGVDGLPTVSNEIVASYVRDHAVMRDMLTARNSKFFVALQPDRRAMEVKGGQAPKDEVGKVIGERYLSFTEQVAAELVKKGLPNFNFNNLGAALNGSHFMDEVHLNNEGNSIIAQKLLAEINPSHLP